MGLRDGGWGRVGGEEGSTRRGRGKRDEYRNGERGEWCSILNKVSCEVTGEWVEVWREEDKSRERESVGERGLL